MTVITYILIALAIVVAVYWYISSVKNLNNAIESIGNIGKEIENAPFIISDHIYTFYYNSKRYTFTGAQLLPIIQNNDLTNEDLSKIAPAEVIEKIKAMFNQGA